MKKLLLATLLMLGWSALMAQMLPYQNPNLSAEQRAEDLLGRLTLEEKVKLMMDTSPAIPRLGIPQFQWWSEALHGVGRNGYTTVFPITTMMAASWDDELVYKVFSAVSDEARAKNQEAKNSGKIQRYQGLSFWTPNINIFRDPRWGRGQETYGEDPYLTERMGLAVVNGLQGQDYANSQQLTAKSKYKKLLACAKHFAVHNAGWSVFLIFTPDISKTLSISRSSLTIDIGESCWKSPTRIILFEILCPNANRLGIAIILASSTIKLSNLLSYRFVFNMKFEIVENTNLELLTKNSVCAFRSSRSSLFVALRRIDASDLSCLCSFSLSIFSLLSLIWFLKD